MWVPHLDLLPIGEAQAAYWALPREDASNYDKAKAAIFQRLDVSKEPYRQLLRGRRARVSHPMQAGPPPPGQGQQVALPQGGNTRTVDRAHNVGAMYMMLYLFF